MPRHNHLNTNKQFMIGNGILAFAVLFVVVLFVYMSLRMQRKEEGTRRFLDTYTVVLERGFAGDSVALLINDSLLLRRRIGEEPCSLQVERFSRQSVLMVVDCATDRLSLFELGERSATYRLEKSADGVRLLPETVRATH